MEKKTGGKVLGDDRMQKALSSSKWDKGLLLKASKLIK